MGAEPHQMAVEARELGEHDAGPLSERWNIETEKFFGGQTVNQIVGKGGEIIDPVRQGDTLLIGFDLEFLFDARMQIADVGRGLQNGFAIEFEQQAQHTVRGWAAEGP